MAGTGWMLVETLDPARSTVVARDHQPRSRTSLHRAIRDSLGDTRAGAETTRWLEALIADIRSQPRPGAIGHSPAQTVGIRVVPVTGPDRVLYGAHVWVGAADAAPEQPPRPAFGFIWDSRLRLAEVPAALAAEMSVTGTPKSRFTAPEVFRFLTPADTFSLLRTLLTAEPDAVWEGAVTVGAGRRQTPSHMVLVPEPAPEESDRWRGLLFETASGPPLPHTIEAAALAALPRISPVHIALVDIAKMRLIRWITDPIAEVQWKGQVDQRDTPHPDDVKRIFEAAAEMFTGKAASAAVAGIRLRRRGGGWVVADGSGAIVRTSPDSPALGVVQLRVTGHSDEPDPVPPTDGGHPGLDDPDYPGYPLK